MMNSNISTIEKVQRESEDVTGSSVGGERLQKNRRKDSKFLRSQLQAMTREAYRLQSELSQRINKSKSKDRHDKKTELATDPYVSS